MNIFITTNALSAKPFRRNIDPQKVLRGHAKRVLVEGASGTGKSLLCHYLAYGWATGTISNLKK